MPCLLGVRPGACSTFDRRALSRLRGACEGCGWAAAHGWPRWPLLAAVTPARSSVAPGLIWSPSKQAGQGGWWPAPGVPCAWPPAARAPPCAGAHAARRCSGRRDRPRARQARAAGARGGCCSPEPYPKPYERAGAHGRGVPLPAAQLPHARLVRARAGRAARRAAAARAGARRPLRRPQPPPPARPVGGAALAAGSGGAASGSARPCMLERALGSPAVGASSASPVGSIAPSGHLLSPPVLRCQRGLRRRCRRPL